MSLALVHASASTARRRVFFSALMVAASGVTSAKTGTPASLAHTPQYGSARSVQDGDSFVFENEAHERWRIRIAGIDAPELTQPYGTAARDFMQALLQHGRLRIEPIKRDVYGRVVAQVTILPTRSPAQDAALAALDAGLAWHFRRYTSDQTPIEALRYRYHEQKARALRHGLWQDPDPEAPWRFRARSRADRPQPPTTSEMNQTRSSNIFPF